MVVDSMTSSSTGREELENLYKDWRAKTKKALDFFNCHSQNISEYAALQNAANEVENTIALLEWRKNMAEAIQSKPDYLIISIGSAGSDLQILPPFAVELAKQGKKIQIINIDQKFDVQSYRT